MQAYDVVIIGGGLVGLCTAAHFIDTPHRVGVLLGTHKGCASQAAAGMLAPTCEWSPEAPSFWLNFLRSGRDYYKEFLAKVLGHPQDSEIGYAEKPFLLLDLLESENGLANRFECLQAAGADVTWLNRSEACQLEPYLNPEAVRGAIRVVGDALVNPRALHCHLLERLSQQGVDLLETNLRSTEERGGSFILQLDNGSTLVCPRIIVAAGAWSFEVAEQFYLDVPVSPAKGQIVQLSGTAGVLKHILYMPVGACGCLLERAPGIYVAGTSEEYISAEVTNTSRIVAAILTRINNVFLPAGDFVITDMWSGFRPIMPDELPTISLSSDPRVIIATGHFRNGVLLAPLTGLIVKSLFEGKEPVVDVEPYSYSRKLHLQYRFASAY